MKMIGRIYDPDHGPDRAGSAVPVLLFPSPSPIPSTHEASPTETLPSCNCNNISSPRS